MAGQGSVSWLEEQAAVAGLWQPSSSCGSRVSLSLQVPLIVVLTEAECYCLF